MSAVVREFGRPDTTTMTDSLPDCATDCPHRKDVSNACGHEFGQALVGEFTENPGMTCPFIEGD